MRAGRLGTAPFYVYYPATGRFVKYGAGRLFVGFLLAEEPGRGPWAPAGELTKNGTAGMMNAGRTLLHNRRLATPPGKGVRLMGHGRWAKALRFTVTFLAVLWLLAYTAPKAC